MGETSYDFNLLFREEGLAESFFEKLRKYERDAGSELVELVRRCCGRDVESNGFEFDIEDIRRFRNEIRISSYTGRSSDYPDEIVDPLNSAGAQIVRMSAYVDDAPGSQNRYFVDGKKTVKRAYDKEFKAFKVEDTTDKLQRLLSSNRMAQASKIVDECDLGRIVGDDEIRWELIKAHKQVDMAIKLLKAGLFDEPQSVYKTPWLPTVVANGRTELLRAFLDYGMDPYAGGPSDRLTSLHAAVYDAEQYWLPNLELLIEHCKDNLDPVTEYGCPLWYGYENFQNAAACERLRAAGATVIPPEGFYDDMEGIELVVEAIKHGDLETARSNYEPDHYHDALFWALQHQHFEAVQWLNEQSPVDWEQKAAGKVSTVAADDWHADFPFYELPYCYSHSTPPDARLLAFVIDNIPSKRELYSHLLIYVSGMQYMPEAGALMTKLIELGADLDVHMAIDADPEKTNAASFAMRHCCYDNMEVLLKAGVDARPQSQPDGSALSDWLSGYSGDQKRYGTAILKKYQVE